MNCGQCGRSNRPGALFCGGCGTGLTRRCAKCDAELDSDLAFCDRCGTPVGDLPAAPQAFSPAAPDTAVRKTVTVVFADLGGSTSFGERTDSSYCVIVLDDDGQATSCEFFGEHQWNDALMRFDELSEA